MKNNNNNNNNFLKDIINNKFYNRYKLLLNNNKDSSEIQKDIERYVSESWKNEFLNLLKSIYYIYQFTTFFFIIRYSALCLFFTTMYITGLMINFY